MHAVGYGYRDGQSLSIRYGEPIRVKVFEGTVEQAVLEAGKANTRVKLSMDMRSRQNLAWRLVLMGSYTKPEMRLASGVSDGRIGIMRRVVKALGEQAFRFRAWWRAQQATRALPGSRCPITK